MSTLTDPRDRTKVFLDLYLTPANFTKDNGTTPALFITHYANPLYPLKSVFFGSKNRDLTFAIDTPISTPIRDSDEGIIGYDEKVPIQIFTVDKTGITGELLRWKAERELRRIIETHWQGSIRSLERMSPKSRDMGGWTLYSVEYMLDYIREKSGVTGTADAGGDTTHTVDAERTEANDYWNGFIIKYTSGNNTGLERLISDFDDATNTITHAAFPYSVTAGETYILGVTKPSITYGIGAVDDCNSLYGTSTGTADAGGDTTHTVDAERTEGNDLWNGSLIYYTSGSNVGLERLITDFVTGTITHVAFPNAVATGDTYKLSKWAETDTGTLLTEAVSLDDYFVLTRTAGANEAYISYPTEGTNHTSHLNLSPTVYTKIFWRFKTSSSNLKAKIVLIDSSGHPQTVLAETDSALFSAGSATINFGDADLLDHIRLYANALASATGTVTYDFVLVCKNTFAFPNTEHGTEFTPPPRNVDIGIPSRITDVSQNLGSPNATWTASCNLDIGNWKRSSDYIDGEVFVDIAHNSYQEPFQWLDTGEQQFKVTLDTLRFPKRSDSHTVDLTFKEYSRSSKSNESYVERFGLNI